jgi:hypothetical protein
MTREKDKYLEVVDRDTAETRWWACLRPEVLDTEEVPLAAALGRVLGRDVVAEFDVPPFFRELLGTRDDRSRLADAGLDLTERPEP